MTSKPCHGRTPATSTAYTVEFRAPMPVFRLSRKAARQRPVRATSTSRRRYIVNVRPVPSVAVRCIAVDSPSHLFLAGRACIPTHNSAGARVSLLNDLAAGIFPVLYDPVKSLGDFSEFVGIIPMGCTPEHRDVILAALHAERDRRNKAINGRSMKDRHGRTRPEPGVFQIGRDGPQIRSYWDEFHRNAADKAFLASFLDLMRVQRAVAMDSEVYTQGGGLQDLGDSVVRGLLNQVRMRLYRMPDNLARLAGYNGDYMPSNLPRVAGACLLITEGVPVIPLRGAWVTRDDEDGCVYDVLYAPDGSPLLVAPKLPAETLEVFRREGLLDLWNLGKGPNGLANLIGDTPSAPAPSAVGGTRAADGTAAAGPLQAADVILAIALQQPGCPRSALEDHPVWKTTPAGGKVPVPSTISRAALRLVNEGLLTRDDNAYQVTASGQARALAAAQVLFPEQFTPTPAPTAGAPVHASTDLGNDVLSVLADAALAEAAPVGADAILLALRSRGRRDLDRPTLVAKLAGMREHGAIVCVGDQYELSATLLADLAEQFEDDLRAARGRARGGDLTGPVLEAMAGGPPLSVEDLCTVLAADGWAPDAEQLAPTVTSTLMRLRERGLVRQQGQAFAVTEAAIELLGEASSEHDETEQ